MNSTPDMSLPTIWGSHKAYLSGQIISYSAFERRKRTLRTDHPKSRNGQKEQLLQQTEVDHICQDILNNFHISLGRQFMNMATKRVAFYHTDLKSERLLEPFLRSVWHLVWLPHNPKLLIIYNNLYPSESVVDVSED